MIGVDGAIAMKQKSRLGRAGPFPRLIRDRDVSHDSAPTKGLAVARSPDRSSARSRQMMLIQAIGNSAHLLGVLEVLEQGVVVLFYQSKLYLSMVESD